MATLVDARIVFKLATEHGAAAIVMVHNHPSGSTEPSTADILLTEKLLHGGKILGYYYCGPPYIYRYTLFSFFRCRFSTVLG